MDSTILTKQISKRAIELGKIADKFIAEWNSNPQASKILLRENAGEKLAHKYFELLNTTIKGQYLNPSGLANRYKVAAGTEIAFMLVLPLDFEDAEYSFADKKRLNSRLAITAALQLLYSIEFDTSEDINITTTTKSSLEPIIKHHQIWLTYLNLKDISALPTLLNANFWEAYFVASTA